MNVPVAPLVRELNPYATRLGDNLEYPTDLNLI